MRMGEAGRDRVLWCKTAVESWPHTTTLHHTTPHSTAIPRYHHTIPYHTTTTLCDITTPRSKERHCLLQKSSPVNK